LKDDAEAATKCGGNTRQQRSSKAAAIVPTTDSDDDDDLQIIDVSDTIDIVSVVYVCMLGGQDDQGADDARVEA
jgi:hypothetical protein